MAARDVVVVLGQLWLLECRPPRLGTGKEWTLEVPTTTRSSSNNILGACVQERTCRNHGLRDLLFSDRAAIVFLPNKHRVSAVLLLVDGEDIKLFCQWITCGDAKQHLYGSESEDDRRMIWASKRMIDRSYRQPGPGEKIALVLAR